MGWPTDDIVTTALDQGTDTPPRAEFLNIAQIVKELIAGRATANGVCDLDASGKIPAARIVGRHLIDVQVFTAGGTWTKPTGCIAAEVWCVGGGAGGNGVNAGSQTAPCAAAAAGGSGGSGAYSFLTSALGATETVTVGAGGVGGPANGSDAHPGVGGTSSFGSHVSAVGGSYDGNDLYNITIDWAVNDGYLRAITTNVGQVKVPGGASGNGNVVYNTGGGAGSTFINAQGGKGGDGAFGLGAGGLSDMLNVGGAGTVLSRTGIAGIGYGAGGSGSIAVNSPLGAVVGGAGTGGIVIVKSYT